MNVRAQLLIAILLQAGLLSHASAGAWSPDTARILGDPAFLPLGGQVEGSFGYTYSANLYDFQGSSPFQRLNSWDRSANDFLPFLRYGITDTVSVSAELNFGNSRSTDSTTSQRLVFPQVTPIVRTNLAAIGPIGPFPRPVVVVVPERLHERSVGADDPVFALTWRAIDERMAPVDLDLSAGYVPDTFQARSAGVDQTGTRAAGGQTGFVEAALSREMQALTVRAYLEFNYDGRRDISEPGGFQVDRIGAHPSYTGGVQTQTRVLPWLALNAGFGAAASVQYDDVSISSFGPGFRSSVTVKPSASIGPYVGVLFPLWGNHVVGEILYQHDFITDQKDDSAVGSSGRYFDQESNFYAARVRFVFGTR